jgi:nucleoside-triphosphatase THEP1
MDATRTPTADAGEAPAATDARATAVAGAADPHGLPVAAVLNDGPGDVDALLAEVVDTLRAQGRRVNGLLMTFPDARDGCAGTMVMVDLANGDEYLVSQPMGRDSRACRANPQGFAQASVVLRRALATPPELVVLNRFGSLEAEGGGFRAELLDLMVAGQPLLTAVSPKHLEAWREFVGGPAELPADRQAILDWVARVVPGAPSEPAEPAEPGRCGGG